MAEKVKTIYMDLIEPKFDQTHEVSRAMVEFNRSIQSFCEELKNDSEDIERIGTAMFNRKVWASENEKDHPLLREDHYLFSNLSSKFELEKGDKDLFESIKHSLEKIKEGELHNKYCAREGYPELHGDIDDAGSRLFKYVHREDWENFIKLLNAIYKNVADYREIEINGGNNFLDTLFNKAEVVCEWFDKEDTDKGSINELKDLLRDFTILLRMPVLGLFPGTLAREHIKDSKKRNKPLVYLTYLNGENMAVRRLSQRRAVDEGKVKNIVQLEIFSLEKLSKAEKSKIVNIMTKLTQLLVKGMPLDVSHTVFLSIPIHKSYYSVCEKASGTIVGFLQGWVFIPIKLKEPEAEHNDEQREKYINGIILSLIDKEPITNLIEACLIAGNMLVENVRSAGARRAVGQANVDDDDIIALENSVHHMTGWKVTSGDDKDADILGDEHQLWGDGTKEDPVRVRLGNRSENGDYEVDNTGKVILLTRSADAIFVKPLGRSESEPEDDLSDEDIYLYDLAQRLRTVHALIIDKQGRARGKAYASMKNQEQTLAHELGQVTGFLGDEYILTQEKAKELLDKMEPEKAEEYRSASRIILAPKIFEAARDYIYIWAPPKRGDSSYMRESDVDIFLNNIKQKVRMAGLAKKAKGVLAQSFTKHETLLKDYEKNNKISVLCQEELKFIFHGNKEIQVETMRLLFRIIAAATLNAVKHAGKNGKVFIIGCEDSIWIVNSVREGGDVNNNYDEREDGDGTLRVLNSVWERIPIDNLQPPKITMGILPNSDIPLSCIGFPKEWVKMFKIRIAFSSGILKARGGN